ncbi:MAG: hypothetical protein Q4D04_02090 [Clostridia bacterium]|nr:hypothetical protein [Clostridia bacterium]
MKRLLNLSLCFICLLSLAVSHAQERIDGQLLPKLALNIPAGDIIERDYVTSGIVVEALKPDLQMVKDCFAPNGVLIDEDSRQALEGFEFDGAYYTAKYDDGVHMLVRDNQIYYNTHTGRCVTQTIALAGTSMLNDEASNGAGLSFKSARDVEMQAREILEKLSISGDIALTGCYAIDGRTLQSVTSEIIRDSDIRSDIRDGYIEIKLDWNENDDFYYLTFSQVFDGIPLDKDGFTSIRQDYYIEPSGIVMIISENGLECIKADGLVKQTGEKGEQKPLIGYEKALELLKAKYKRILKKDMRYVNGMHLCFVPAPVKGTPTLRKLVPIWYIRVCPEPDWPWEDSTRWTAFNAITGKEV